MMKLVLIRHAESNKMANLAGEPDAPSPAGKVQIENLIDTCRAENVEVIFHSEQSRAVFAAEALGLALHIPSLAQSGLEERRFGDWDDWEWPRIAAKLDQMSAEERYTFVPPNGESWQQMETRLRAALKRIDTKQYSSVAIVTHWGPIRALLPMLRNESKESTLDLNVAPGEAFIFNTSNE